MVQADGSVFGGLTTHLVWSTHTNLNFDHCLSKSEVMAKVMAEVMAMVSTIGWFYKDPFDKIAVEQEVITFEASMI